MIPAKDSLKQPHKNKFIKKIKDILPQLESISIDRLGIKPHSLKMALKQDDKQSYCPHQGIVEGGQPQTPPSTHTGHLDQYHPEAQSMLSESWRNPQSMLQFGRPTTIPNQNHTFASTPTAPHLSPPQKYHNMAHASPQALLHAEPHSLPDQPSQRRQLFPFKHEPPRQSQCELDHGSRPRLSQSLRSYQSSNLSSKSESQLLHSTNQQDLDRKSKNKQSAKQSRDRKRLYLEMLTEQEQTLSRQLAAKQKELEETRAYLQNIRGQSESMSSFTTTRHKMIKRLEELVSQAGNQEGTAREINAIIDSLSYRIGATGKERINSINEYFRQIVNLSLPALHRYMMWSACEGCHLFGDQASQDNVDWQDPEEHPRGLNQHGLGLNEHGLGLSEHGLGFSEQVLNLHEQTLGIGEHNPNLSSHGLGNHEPGFVRKKNPSQLTLPNKPIMSDHTLPKPESHARAHGPVSSSNQDWFLEVRKQLQLTSSQLQQIKKYQPMLRQQRQAMQVLIQELHLIREDIEKESIQLEDTIYKIREVLTPFQCAHFILFIERNKYRKELTLSDIESSPDPDFKSLL